MGWLCFSDQEMQLKPIMTHKVGKGLRDAKKNDPQGCEVMGLRYFAVLRGSDQKPAPLLLVLSVTSCCLERKKSVKLRISKS